MFGKLCNVQKREADKSKGQLQVQVWNVWNACVEQQLDAKMSFCVQGPGYV